MNVPKYLACDLIIQQTHLPQLLNLEVYRQLAIPVIEPVMLFCECWLDWGLVLSSDFKCNSTVFLVLESNVQKRRITFPFSIPLEFIALSYNYRSSHAHVENNSALQEACTTLFFPNSRLGRLKFEGGCTCCTGVSAGVKETDTTTPLQEWRFYD